MKCPHCEKEIAGIACPACYEESPEGAEFCMKCGTALAAPEPGEGGGEEYDLDNRILCPDGTCTGIIVDGKCSECGKPYPPVPGTAEEAAEETAENTGGETVRETPEKEATPEKEGTPEKEATPDVELKILSQFAAAHQLREYEGGCERLHGHNWKIEVRVRGEELEGNGLLIDFRLIKSATKKAVDSLDHRFLNDLDPFKTVNPSSENIARYIFQFISDELNSDRVRVNMVTAWESDTACASYFES